MDGPFADEVSHHRSRGGEKVLELGSSSGEFSSKALKQLEWKEYVALDLNPGETDPELFSELKAGYGPGLRFVQANAELLPFEDGYFGVTFSTCLLAHVSDPSKVISEALRVTKPGGSVVFLLPTDPGILNQLTKRLVTYPRMRKHGISMPAYTYALGHVHPFHNLLARLRFELNGVRWKARYRPFFLPSYHLNLWVIVSIRKHPASDF